MRICFVSLCVTAVLGMSVCLVGCNSNSTAAPTNEVPPAPSAGAEHDDHAGHDHGADAGHEHPTEGPHGGHLIELGDEAYQAELLHDESTHTVTIHLLDGAAERTVAVPLAEMTLQLFRDGQFVKYALTAVAGAGDDTGSASRFEIVDRDLCDALCQKDETRGRLQVTIDGKPYTGTIEHTSECEAHH